MSITDLLTQIEVSPGLPGPLSDSGIAQRSGSKPQPNSDYRDKLARTLNDAPPEPSSRGASSAPSSSEPQAPARSVAPRESTPVARGTSPKSAPEQPDAKPVSDASSNAPKTTDAEAAQNDTQPQSSITVHDTVDADDSTDVPEIDFEIDELTAEEISRTAIALLTVTATVPTLEKADEPTAPYGLYQLLQADALSPSTDPELSFATKGDGASLPPSGLLAAFDISTVTAENRVNVHQKQAGISSEKAQPSITTYSIQQPLELETVVVAATSDAVGTQPIIDGSTSADQTEFATVSTSTLFIEADDQEPERVENIERSPEIAPSFHPTLGSQLTTAQSDFTTSSQQQVVAAPSGPTPEEQTSAVQEPHVVAKARAPQPAETEVRPAPSQPVIEADDQEPERVENIERSPEIAPSFHPTLGSQLTTVQVDYSTSSQQHVVAAPSGPTPDEQTSVVQEPHVVAKARAPQPAETEVRPVPSQHVTIAQDDIQAAGRPLELFAVKDSDTSKHGLGTTLTTTDLQDDGASASDRLNLLASPNRTEAVASTHQTQQSASSTTKNGTQGLVEQVSNAMQFATESGRALRVRLHPPELGVLQIEISSKDGLLTARLETQTASAQHAIVENLSSLREALAHAGSHVERIEVQVAENRGSDNLSQHADRQEDDGQQQNSQQQRRQEESGHQQEEESNRPTSPAPNSIDQLDIQI